MATPALSLDDIAGHVGIDLTKDPVMKYLKALRITTVSTIAVYLKDTSSIRDLVTKLNGKTQLKGTDYDLDNKDPDAITAQWTVFLSIAQQEFQRQPAPAPTPAAPLSSSSTSDTVPKTLPPGVYAKLVQDHNSITIDGEKRHFPEKVLLGADKILARMYHEHTLTKHYTAVTLGEIMAHRAPSVTKEPEDCDVRESMMIQHGIEAAKWAWILIKTGTETSVIKYCEWIIRLVRKNSSRLAQIKVLWETFTGEIAMHIRPNESFPNITDELMTDLTSVNDALMQSPPKKQRSEQSPWRTGKGKGKGKGKESHPSLGPGPPRRGARSRNQRHLPLSLLSHRPVLHRR